MLPKTHFLLGLIFSIFMFFILKVSLFHAAVFFLASFLIDADHNLYYLYKKHDLNFFRAFEWFGSNKSKLEKLSGKQRDKIYTGIYFFHGIEAIFILVILSYFSQFFLFMLAGFIFHQIFDLIELYREGMPFNKVISFLYSIKKAKNKKLLQEV